MVTCKNVQRFYKVQQPAAANLSSSGYNELVITALNSLQSQECSPHKIKVNPSDIFGAGTHLFCWTCTEFKVSTLFVPEHNKWHSATHKPGIWILISKKQLAGKNQPHRATELVPGCFKCFAQNFLIYFRWLGYFWREGLFLLLLLQEFGEWWKEGRTEEVMV